MVQFKELITYKYPSLSAKAVSQYLKSCLNCYALIAHRSRFAHFSLLNYIKVRKSNFIFPAKENMQYAICNMFILSKLKINNEQHNQTNI